MKKILFCLITFGILYSNASAQFTQGSVSAGGSFQLWFDQPKTVDNNQTTNGPKTTNFTLLPSVEYFISDALSLGLGIGYDFSSTKTVNGNTTTTNKSGIFDFDPYARKYLKLGDRFSFFGQAGLSLGFGNNTYEINNGGTTVSNKYAKSSFSLGISPGILFLVSDKVALETSFGFLGYEGSSTDQANGVKDKTNDFGIQLNTSTLYFGFRYFIK